MGWPFPAGKGSLYLGPPHQTCHEKSGISMGLGVKSPEKNTSPKLIWYPWSLTLQLANRERVGIFQPPLFFFFRGRSCQTWEEYSPKKGTNEKKGRLMTFFSTKCTILSGTRWVIERTCAIETGKKQHRSKFEINMHKFEKANYFSNGAHTQTLITLQKLGAQKSQVVVVQKDEMFREVFLPKNLPTKFWQKLRTFFSFPATLGADELHHCPRSTFSTRCWVQNFLREEIESYCWCYLSFFWRSHKLLYMKPCENWDILHINWLEESLKHQELDFVTSIEHRPKPLWHSIVLFDDRDPYFMAYEIIPI